MRSPLLFFLACALGTFNDGRDGAGLMTSEEKPTPKSRWDRATRPWGLGFVLAFALLGILVVMLLGLRLIFYLTVIMGMDGDPKFDLAFVSAFGPFAIAASGIILGVIFTKRSLPTEE
jgi:hypothetical protein